MSLLRDAGYGLWGAARLLRFDPTGASAFPNTGEAAWRSFKAFWLIAPLYAAFMLLIHGGKLAGTAATIHLVGVMVIAQLAIIPAYLLIVFYVLRLMRLDDRFDAYVGAYNWMTVVQILVAIVGTGLALTPALGQGGTGLLQAALGILLLVYSGYVAKTVLGLDWILAVGLVVLEMTVTGMVGILTDALLLRTSGAG